MTILMNNPGHPPVTLTITLPELSTEDTDAVCKVIGRAYPSNGGKNAAVARQIIAALQASSATVSPSLTRIRWSGLYNVLAGRAREQVGGAASGLQALNAAIDAADLDANPDRPAPLANS